MKNLKSQLNKKLQYHLNCITKLSPLDLSIKHNNLVYYIDGLSHSDHKQAVNTLNEVLTQIKINEECDKVNSNRKSRFYCGLCNGEVFLNKNS